MKYLILFTLLSTQAYSQVCTLKLQTKDSKDRVLATDGHIIESDKTLKNTYRFKSLDFPYRVTINQSTKKYSVQAIGKDSVVESEVVKRFGSKFQVVKNTTKVGGSIFKIGKNLRAEVELKCPLDV